VRYPKYHPELSLGKNLERGTPQTFVAALKNAGFDFSEVLKLDNKWVDRLGRAK
jgi:hypothetical protein